LGAMKREYSAKIAVHDSTGLYKDRIGALDEMVVRGDTLSVELYYPQTGNEIKKIEIGLMCVRAADSILIEYDFDRDGYSIKQASTFERDGDDPACDPDWQEVAFVQAWVRKVEPVES
jgi:hypothetical protein